MLENEPGSSVTGIGSDRLFTAAPEALVVVRDHRIELANDAAVALLGVDPVGYELIADWVEGADAGCLGRTACTERGEFQLAAHPPMTSDGGDIMTRGTYPPDTSDATRAELMSIVESLRFET